jgi:hypothetical protein
MQDTHFRLTQTFNRPLTKLRRNDQFLRSGGIVVKPDFGFIAQFTGFYTKNVNY